MKELQKLEKALKEIKINDSLELPKLPKEVLTLDKLALLNLVATLIKD